MSGGLLMWIRMKTWLTCWRSHWVVRSEPSLFGWFCIMFSQRKGMGIWEEIKSFLLPPRIGTTYPFAHMVWVLKFRVGAVGFNRFRVGAVGFRWLVFFFYFFVLGGDDWAIQSGILSDCIPHWFERSVSILCYPILDSMALLGGSSVSVLCQQSVRTERLSANDPALEKLDNPFIIY